MMKNKKAFTITELMISVVIISTVVLIIAGAFGSIQKAIQYSKDRAIAVNLAQEKIHILKEKSYYKVVPSTSISYLNDFSPPVPYDNLFFPPETILEAGIYYTRYTYIIPVSETGGSIIELPPETPDTGMKKIVITVVWMEKNDIKKVQLSTIYSNKDTIMANAAITGKIKDNSTYLPISQAIVNIAEYLGAKGITDPQGYYRITIPPGNYTIYAEARGYFPYLGKLSVGPEQTLNYDINLVPMGYGKITGIGWIVDHLVISQIVGSSISTQGVDQEYVEIYNPTTYTWLIQGEIGIRFQRIYDSDKKTVDITYLSTSIAPNSFYLFANTTPVIINGNSIAADAIWSDENSTTDFPYFNNYHNIIPVFGDGTDEGGGAIEIYSISTAKSIDSVGWNRNDGAKKIAPFYETAPIPQNVGLERGEAYIRYSSTYSISSAYGPSYDSNNNSVDFYDLQNSTISPRNSNTTLPRISGTPAAGAIVSCSDGLSISTTAYSIGSRPYAYFELNQIATGTWSCSISSASYVFIIDSITITQGSTITLNSVFLTTQITWGYISGSVVDAYGNGIIPAIKITASDGSSTFVNSKRYLLQTNTTGYINVTANPDNLNPSYVSISSEGINVGIGEIKSGVDFVLPSGGRITGKVLIANTTIPVSGVAVVIYDIYNAVKDQDLTDSTGRFITNVLSTGTYIIEPVVDPKEKIVPSTTSINLLTPGSLIFSTTFYLSNAMGYISGSVKYQNQPVRTGVLIVVTTKTLSGTPPSPPALSSQTLTIEPYYISSANEEGNYIVEVRQSTNPAYIVYAYYPYLSSDGSSFTVYYSSRTNIKVWAGQTTSNIDFSW